MSVFIDNIDSIILIIYCIVIGIIIAFVYSLITKSIYGRLVDALVKASAENEASARSLGELGVKNNPLISLALKRKTVLSSLISCDDETADIEKKRFYILPEHKLKLQSIYGREKLSLKSIVITVILLAVLFVVFQYVIPGLFK